jgi:hypothetical protein
MGREQAVPLPLVHRLRRGRGGGHENEAGQTRRVCSRTGERELTAHRVTDENVTVEAKTRDVLGDCLSHCVQAVDGQRSRKAETGQVESQAP